MKRLGWGVATAVYLAAVYALSSLPDSATGLRMRPGLLFLSNMSHAPIYAGLAYCVLKTVAGTRVMWEHVATAFALTAAAAAFDEWHQSFVPGRTMSAADWLVDLFGITAALAWIWARQTNVNRECEAD